MFAKFCGGFFLFAGGIEGGFVIVVSGFKFSFSEADICFNFVF